MIFKNLYYNQEAHIRDECQRICIKLSLKHNIEIYCMVTKEWNEKKQAAHCLVQFKIGDRRFETLSELKKALKNKALL